MTLKERKPGKDLYMVSRSNCWQQPGLEQENTRKQKLHSSLLFECQGPTYLGHLSLLSQANWYKVDHKNGG